MTHIIVIFIGVLGVGAAYLDIFPLGSSMFSSIFFFYAGFHSSEVYWSQVYNLTGLGVVLILLGFFMFVNAFFVVIDMFKEDEKRGVINA